MIDAAEREKVWRELSQWLHFQMCAAQNLPWEEGDNCEDCRAAVDEKILPLLALCANEALEKAAQQPENMARGRWREGSGIYEELFNAATRIRALKAEAPLHPPQGGQLSDLAGPINLSAEELGKKAGAILRAEPKS